MIWLPARLDAGPVNGTLALAAALTYRAGGVVCHQDPDRSFHRGRMPLPVCARCTGLYGAGGGGGGARGGGGGGGGRPGGGGGDVRGGGGRVGPRRWGGPGGPGAAGIDGTCRCAW